MGFAERPRDRRKSPRIVSEQAVSMSPAGRAGGREADLRLTGYTRDLSEGGLSVVAPSFDCAHVEIFYEGREVDVSLGLPQSSVTARAVSVRATPLDAREPGAGCVIALTIKGMGEDDRSRYADFLRRARSPSQ